MVHNFKFFYFFLTVRAELKQNVGGINTMKSKRRQKGEGREQEIYLTHRLLSHRKPGNGAAILAR